jgi:hypothetical protein
MKKTMLGTVVCLGGLMGTASAQMTETVKVTLPCAASVGGVTLPAGEYTIRDMQFPSGTPVMQISSFGGKSVDVLALAVEAPKEERPDGTKLILQQSGQGYHIQTLWIEGENIGYQFVGK